ncbi:hypothetical protein P7K49_040782, partial [Saguinus oedipus]
WRQTLLFLVPTELYWSSWRLEESHAEVLDFLLLYMISTLSGGQNQKKGFVIF